MEWTVPSGVYRINLSINSNLTTGWIRYDDVEMVDITDIKGLDTRISTAESSITQLSTSITSKVDVNGVISTIQQNADAVKIAFNKINSAKVTIDTAGLHVSGGSIDGVTITSTASNSKLTINGASVVGTTNGVKGIALGWNSLAFYDGNGNGALSGGINTSYLDNNPAKVGISFGTTQNYISFGKQTSDGSSISPDFYINYNANPSGYLEKFIMYGDLNMAGNCINNVGKFYGDAYFRGGTINFNPYDAGNGLKITNGSTISYQNIDVNGHYLYGVDRIYCNTISSTQSNGNVILNGNLSGPFNGQLDFNRWNSNRACFYAGDNDSSHFGTVHVGDFYSHGSKNRAVKTESYGVRALNAYEMTESYFGDMKRNQIVNGMCIINIDPMFLETVTANMQYEVFVSPYGNGNVWVEPTEMYPTYFIVRGSADIPFVWELKVKQRGYEYDRLKEVDMPTLDQAS
jgi:hypothetical protein